MTYEVCTGIPFAFSITFGDEPERKHLFSGHSETYIYEWVNALRRSSYEHWRSQLILLQSKISSKTGKDPLLMCPHNQGQVRDIEPVVSPVSGRKMKPVGKKSSTFQSHIAAMPTNESTTFQSHVAAMPTNKSTTNKETNLIEF
uniref:PH domain-containing protein n=1 Tax=Timema shepardi TaxID=629360 RepID=A0A7R9AU84_TIMSH|nr:unnamed protein product [Timema shepardi]